MELWSSNGTKAGTQPTKRMSTDTWMHDLVARGNTLFFLAGEGESIALWRSDGTAAGTHPVTTQTLFWGSDLMLAGNHLFFVADDPTHGIELWTSDGTKAGTKLVKDIKKTGSSNSSEPMYLTDVAGTLFFSAAGAGGRELWKSDGTETGTVRVADINPGGPSNPRALVAVGSEVYFSADDGTHGIELWKSDGTDPGTVLLKDIRHGSEGALPRNDDNAGTLMAAFGDVLVFAADDGSHGSELWQTDGSRPGTVMVADINDGAGSDPMSSAVLGDRLLFTADDGVHGTEVWVYQP